MLKKLDEQRANAEAEIRLFLRLFPLFAAHFEMKQGVNGISMFSNMAFELSKRYDSAVIDEIYADKDFILSLPSAIPMPSIKQDILEEEQ